MKHCKPEMRIRSRATLIITPPAILNQWEREIRRHISNKDALKIVVYPGVQNICSEKTTNPSQSIRFVHPLILADADIVLMTFTSLMNELGHSSENPFVTAQHKQLRKRKRYRVVPSPLTSINWWRICLDEAQNVDTPTASSAKMALQLTGNHKWCKSKWHFQMNICNHFVHICLLFQLYLSRHKWYSSWSRRS